MTNVDNALRILEQNNVSGYKFKSARNIIAQCDWAWFNVIFSFCFTIKYKVVGRRIKQFNKSHKELFVKTDVQLYMTLQLQTMECICRTL